MESVAGCAGLAGKGGTAGGKEEVAVAGWADAPGSLADALLSANGSSGAGWGADGGSIDTVGG